MISPELFAEHVAFVVIPTCRNAFCCWTYCSIEPAINDVKAEKIVAEVMKVSLVDMIWPNCLGRAIQNYGLIDVEEYSAKLAKSADKETTRSESRATRSLVAKDKGKKIVVTPLETLIDEISSDSSGTHVGHKLMSSGRQFAQGTIHFLLILLLLFFGRFVYLLPYVDYKPYVLRKLEMSGKELFLKEDVNLGVMFLANSKHRLVLLPRDSKS